VGDYYLGKVKTRSMTTGTGTTAGVTVTRSATAGVKRTVVHISGSSDAAALVTIESPASTVLWRKRFSAAFTFESSFAPGVIEVAGNTDVLVKISASTANCEANLGCLGIVAAGS
jgi:predicted phage gp36 major capsid-like protein